MTEPNPPASDVRPPEPAPAPAAPMCLAARLLNVFAAPSEAFDDIKHKPVNHANWAVPATLIVIIGWFGALLIFSQDNIKQQLKEVSHKAIQKQFEKQHMSQEQMDKAMDTAEKYAGISQMVGAFFLPIFAGFLTPVVWGLIFWVIGAKILGGGFEYMKAVEAVGLGNMIGVLGALVKTLLIVAMGNIFAAPTPMLLVKDWNPENHLHALLGYINILTFWVLAVRAIGISKLSNVSFMRAGLWVFGIWIGYSALFFGFGLAMQQVFSHMGGGK